jgi:hypothetical protein
MPIAIVLMAINVAFVVHAAKTGRFTPWGYIIFLLPGAGAIAYVLVELIPEWMGTYKGQQARKRVISTLNPEKEYRRLSDELAIADTIANRSALGEECLLLGKFDEALAHYDNILTRPLGEEPAYALGKARAEFALGRPQATVATLDDLRVRWPDYQSAEGHLLYARALGESGRTKEALDEFTAVSNYYAGAEARVRWALLLESVGRRDEAKAIYTELLTQMRRAPKFVRKVQSKWIAIAYKQLRA